MHQLFKASILLMMLFVGFTHGLTCDKDQVIIDGACATNDVSVPDGATISYHGSKRITLQIAQTENDATSLDFLITVTTVSDFFLVFGETYINRDAAWFKVEQQKDLSYIVTVVDSYFQQPFPQLPKSDSDFQGGTQDINLLGYLVDSTDPKNINLKVKIRRKYDTQDQYDTLFTSAAIQLQRCLFGIPKKVGDALDSWYTGSFFFVLNAKTSPCQDGQIFNGTGCAQNDVTPPTQNPYVAKSHADDFLSLYYQTNVDGTITVLAKANTLGYFGIGWGSNLMSKMDMTIFNVNQDNPNFPIVIVDDSYSLSTGSPKYDTMIGGTYDLQVLGYEIGADYVSVKYTRKMTNADTVNDFQFAYNQEVPFAFAYSPSTGVSLTIVKHDYKSIGWGTLVLQASDVQSCSAIKKVFINNQCVDNDVSTALLTEQKVFDQDTVDEFLKVQYGIVNDDTLQLLFTIKNIGWFGFGFVNQDNPSKMVNTDIIIFDTITLADESLAIYTQDTYTESNLVPNLDISLGGTNDITLLGYVINTDTKVTQVKVQRKLNTGDTYDYQFVKNSVVNVIYAWMSGYNNIQYHGNNAASDVLNFYYTPTTCPTGTILVINQCQKNNITPLSSYAKDDFLDFQFSIIDEQINMMFTVQNTGWFGLGFGLSMDNVDMIIVSSNDGVVSITDSWSTHKGSPGSDESQGGENNVHLLGYQLTDTELTVKFYRKLNTGDKLDAILVPGNDLNIVYAWGSATQMKFHGNNYALAKFPLRNGYKGTLTGLEITDSSRQFHFWSNFVLWGFVVDIAFIVARFFKTGRYYKEIHASIMGIIVAFTAFVEIWMALDNDILFNGQLSDHGDMTRVHAVMGFIFLIFFILEGMGGSFLNYMLSFKNTGDASSLKIKAFHKYFGYFLYVIGKINVFLGVRMIENDAQQTACISGYIIFIVLRVIMEYLYRKQQKIFSKILFLSSSDDDKETISSSHSLLSTKEGFSGIVDMINSGIETTASIQEAYPNLKYVIFKDNIYSIDKISHPGGKFIFNQVNGKDISRYMFGAYGLESTNMPAHTHSSYAVQLLRQHQIGILNQVNILSENSGSHHIWNLTKDKNLSSSTALFHLESLNRIKINNQHKGMEWLGRHFALSDLNNQKSTRIYTNCLSYSPYNISLFQKMQSNYRSLIQNPSSTVDNSLPQQSNVLPLVIKRYESPTGFSQYAHDSTSESNQPLEIRVEGPQGRGLELSDKSTGLHLIVSGGTGILPFYDLLVYYAKYLMYKALLKKHGEQVAKFYDITNDNFSRNVHQDFKIKVISAFNAPDDDNGALQLLEFMKRVDSENNLNLFDAIVSVKGYTSSNITVDNNYFTQDFFVKHLDNLIVKRAFVCGPPGLNKNVPNALQGLGLDRNQIMVV